MNIPADSMSVDLILFFVSLSVCALFSFIETSITALRLFKLKEIAHATRKYKSLFNTLETNPQVVLITILITSNLASITCAVISQELIEKLFAHLHFSEGFAFSIGIALTTAIVSIFGEIIPKSIAQSMGMNTFSSILWIVNIVYYLLYPFSLVLHKIAHYFNRRSEQEDDSISEKELKFLINYLEDKGIMEHDKTEMLQNIFRMGSTHAKEILVPKSEVVSIEVNQSLDDLLVLFMEYQYSRFPVYKDNPENIIGIIYLKDFFFAMHNTKEKAQLKDLLRPVIFVPDSLKLNEVLKEFRRQQIHMALVLDEFGSTIGLVTLEDVLEEIVGDILDEHDINNEHEKVKELGPETWLVDASIDLDRLRQFLKVHFDVETAVTLGGFINEQLQRLPKKNDHFFYEGYCFTIEKATKKRALAVHITRAETEEQCTIPPKVKKTKK